MSALAQVPFAVIAFTVLPLAVLPISANGAWTIFLGILCNACCVLVGTFLVLRRMSLLGDAISHAVLPGIAIAFLLTGQLSGWPVIVGAMLIGVATSWMTEGLRSVGEVSEDSSLGIVFTALFSLGVVLVSRAAAQTDLDPGCVLYGQLEFAALDTISVLGVEVPRSALSMGGTLLVSLLFVGLAWKELKLVSFDPDAAAAVGLPAVTMHYLLMALTSAVTVTAFEAVGSILVVAMLVVPAATASLLSDRLPGRFAWGFAVGTIAAMGGYAGATYWNTSAAGMMAVVAGGVFGLAVLFSPKQGILGQWWTLAALRLRILAEDELSQLYRREELALRMSRSDSVATAEGTAAGAGAVPAGVVATTDRDRSVARSAAVAAWGWSAWLRAAVRWRLWGQGQIVWASHARGWALTDAGRGVAEAIVRAHRLWESYLREHFDLPLDHLHEPAEEIEHFLGPALQQKIAAHLLSPALDPHGKEIPPVKEPP